MSAKLYRCSAIAAWLLALSSACSTQQLAPEPPPQIAPPPYVQVPHPEGTTLSDVKGIFLDRSAPLADSMKGCEATYEKLKAATQSEQELKDGLRELVKQDPVFYHWCYYSKVLAVENDIKTLTYVDEKQKSVLSTYRFLVPLARAFMAQYQDSRYLRWGIQHYRRLSEFVFYRRLETTPGLTSELVQVSNPFGLWREPAQTSSVLEKYGLAKPAEAPRPATMIAPVAAPESSGRVPAAEELPPADSDIPPPPPAEAAMEPGGEETGLTGPDQAAE